MNDLRNDSAEENNPNSARGASAPRASDQIKTAILRGAEEARREAEAGIPRIRAAASEAAYWMAFGISFTVSFGWTLAQHLTPEVVNAGGREGAKAGRETVRKWVEESRKRHEPKEPALLAAPPVGSESGPACAS